MIIDYNPFLSSLSLLAEILLLISVIFKSYIWCNFVNKAQDIVRHLNGMCSICITLVATDQEIINVSL